MLAVTSTSLEKMDEKLTFYCCLSRVDPDADDGRTRVGSPRRTLQDAGHEARQQGTARESGEKLQGKSCP